MNKVFLALTVFLLMFLAGCSFQAEVDLENSPALINCLDIRDGERFSYRPSEVRDVTVDLAGSNACATIKKTSGAIMRVCSGAEAYLKCEPASEGKAK